jgi:hypothetical protein
MLHELAKSTGQRLLFYCAFGERSAMAVQAAQDAGAVPVTWRGVSRPGRRAADPASNDPFGQDHDKFRSRFGPCRRGSHWHRGNHSDAYHRAHRRCVRHSPECHDPQRLGRQVVALGIHPGIAPGRASRNRRRSEGLEQHQFPGEHVDDGYRRFHRRCWIDLWIGLHQRSRHLRPSPVFDAFHRRHSDFHRHCGSNSFRYPSLGLRHSTCP